MVTLVPSFFYATNELQRDLIWPLGPIPIVLNLLAFLCNGVDDAASRVGAGGGMLRAVGGRRGERGERGRGERVRGRGGERGDEGARGER